MMKHFICYFVVLIIAQNSFCQTLKTNENKSSNVMIGTKMIDFQAFNIDSSNVSLSEIKSKKIILCFWSPTCEICQEELPILSKLQYLYGKKNIEVIAYSIDSNVFEIKKNINDSIDNINFWWNTSRYTLELLIKYEVSKVPFFIVLDRSKKIIAVIDNQEQLLETMNSIMK